MKTEQFNVLIVFTKGERIVCGDHRWVPVAHGVVTYTYRDQFMAEKDILEAALEAGRILTGRKAWS